VDVSRERERNPWSCPYCGVNLVLDQSTHAYVCPVCGLVLDYEMLPSYTQLQHVAPLVLSPDLEDEVVRRAVDLFNKKVAKEVKKLGGEIADEALEALQSVVEKKQYTVSWEALRAISEVKQKYEARTNIDELRERDVWRNIIEFIKRENLSVKPEEVYALAVKYKSLWSGRKAPTIATIFTCIYVKRKLGIEVKVKPRLQKLIKLFEKILSEREPL